MKAGYTSSTQPLGQDQEPRKNCDIEALAEKEESSGLRCRGRNSLDRGEPGSYVRQEGFPCPPDTETLKPLVGKIRQPTKHRLLDRSRHLPQTPRPARLLTTSIQPRKWTRTALAICSEWGLPVLPCCQVELNVPSVNQ